MHRQPQQRSNEVARGRQTRGAAWARQRGGLAAAVAAILIVLPAVPSFAVRQPIIDDNDRVILHGNVHPLARPEFDAGTTPASLPMERMILALQRPPEKQVELEQLLAAQQDPASPNYQRWLTPEEFGEQFGPTAQDLAVVTGWLAAHGFVVDEVAKGRTWINFSGTVAGVEQAFRTQMHDYLVAGTRRHANASDPTIPRGLAGVVGGVVSLNDFPRRPMSTSSQRVTPEKIDPNYTAGSSHYLSPGDFAIIYNLTPLYSAGMDGTGQTIAIVGRTHPSATNWSTFRSSMALPSNPPQVILNGTDPGDLGSNEDGEADLDVEWAGAVARNATIKFVISKSTFSTDGVDLSAQYIVNNNLAAVMSTSFGACESAMGTSENAFWNNLWSQAAAQGMTSFVASGDSGASGCDAGSDAKGSGLAVSGLASTPYDVAVGGTQFNEGSGTYWNSGNGAGGTSARSYIPESAWNESGAATSCPSGDSCSDLWATSGGASAIYAKPAWQVCSGVPADNKRDIPDVSLTAAAGHDGYLVQTQGVLYAIGGTSATSPSFAGLMALIVQKTGQRQGNANPRLYQLGNAQYGAAGTAVFHDTLSGNNSVPGVSGYACTAGYDRATGLGSVDANALVNNWSVTTPAPTATPTVTSIPTPTATSSPTSTSIPTATPTSPATLPPTVTATATPTNTEVPIPTNPPTSTPPPAATATRSPVPVASATPSDSPTEQPTVFPDTTPSPTLTATVPPSSTPIPTSTATGSATSTSMPLPTATATPSSTFTPTPTATATATPTLPLVRGNARNPRTDRSGCQVQWAVTLLQPSLDRFGLPKTEQTCVDGDPSCDFKPEESGVCAFQVAVCLNNDDPNLPACVPSGISSVTVRSPQPAQTRAAVLQAALTQDLAALQNGLLHLVDPSNPDAGFVNAPPLNAPQENFCSAPFTIDVPVTIRATRSSRGSVTLRTRSTNGSVARRVALSSLTLTCVALPAS